MKWQCMVKVVLMLFYSSFIFQHGVSWNGKKIPEFLRPAAGKSGKSPLAFFDAF